MTISRCVTSAFLLAIRSLTDTKPFTTNFPRADIHEMLSADILHQLIKGTFKDHLVQWIGDYLLATHGETRANDIMDDIDRRYENQRTSYPCNANRIRQNCSRATIPSTPTIPPRKAIQAMDRG